MITRKTRWRGLLIILALIITGCGAVKPATNATAAPEAAAAAEAVTAAVVQEGVAATAEPVAGSGEASTAETPLAAEEAVKEIIEPEATPEATIPEVIIPAIPEETGETHVVNLIDGGFEVPEITIKAGDTIVWQNVREKNPVKALIVAIQPCPRIKSGIFLPGSSFQWKFEKPGKCTIVDGIFTTQAMQVIVW